MIKATTTQKNTQTPTTCPWDAPEAANPGMTSDRRASLPKIKKAQDAVDINEDGQGF
ncbi:MAG: hypothetical protein ABJG41_12025 [Cyclobacteriaceae bacterium]